MTESQFEADYRQTIADAPGLRVCVLGLLAGQNVPWHHHTRITDTFVCMEGTLVLELRAPDETRSLQPGETFAVPPLRPHFVHGLDHGPCRFLIVQGVGEYDYVAEDG